MRDKRIIFLLFFNFAFTIFAMGQENNKFLMMNYHQFIKTDGYRDIDKIESVYVFNDSTLIFPVLEGETLPTNGVVFEVPTWVSRFERVKSISFIGLYVYDLPEEIQTLDSLEFLTFSLAKDCDVSRIAQRVVKIKNLKRLVINSSGLNKEQLEALKNRLPKIQVSDGMEAFNVM